MHAGKFSKNCIITLPESAIYLAISVILISFNFDILQLFSFVKKLKWLITLPVYALCYVSSNVISNIKVNLSKKDLVLRWNGMKTLKTFLGRWRYPKPKLAGKLLNAALCVKPYFDISCCQRNCYTPRNEVRGGGYTGITLSVRLSVDARLGKMVSSA